MNPQDYLDWRARFAEAWQQAKGFMGFISPQEQTDLHLYFEFHKPKSDEEALAWLETIYQNEPELESVALDALEQLSLAAERSREARDQELLPLSWPGRSGHPVIVRAVVKPEPDLKRFARAVIELAREQVAENDEAIQRLVTEIAMDSQPNSYIGGQILYKPLEPEMELSLGRNKGSKSISSWSAKKLADGTVSCRRERT